MNQKPSHIWSTKWIPRPRALESGDTASEGHPLDYTLLRSRRSIAAGTNVQLYRQEPTIAPTGNLVKCFTVSILHMPKITRSRTEPKCFCSNLRYESSRNKNAHQDPTSNRQKIVKTTWTTWKKHSWSHIKGTLRSVMIATAIPRPVYEKYMSRLLCKNDLMLMLKTRVIIAPINTRPRYAFTTWVSF